VDALAVTEEDVFRLDAAEGATRWGQTKERVNAEWFAPCAEVTEAAERVAADEDPLSRKPERDLPPEHASCDRQNDERHTRHVRERCYVERDAEPFGNRSAVALVTVDELDDCGGLPERTDPLIETGAVDDVHQPDLLSGSDGVRGSPQSLSLAMPTEPVLELVDESKLHGNTIPGDQVARHLEDGGRSQTKILRPTGPAAGHPPVSP
jgi:hypothetical protein